MGPEEWETSRTMRIDKALTDFIRKKISADEYQYIRKQSYQEYLEPHGQVSGMEPEAVS